MDLPLCDFYDWTRHETCHRPATWLTHQRSLDAAHPVRYYCDAHRPPRAHPLTVGARREAAPTRKKP